jgi:hypothetical protein
MRHLATFALGAIAGALLALLLTQPATSRQASAPRSAVVTPLVIGTMGTPAADRGADPVERGRVGVRLPGGTPSPTAVPPVVFTSPTTRTGPASVEPVADPTPSATPKPTKRPRATTRPAHGLSGVATWYAYRTGQAAAGPRLRAALGRNWRGRTVLVNGVRAVLTDYMGTHDRAKVIDLDDGLFRRICGPLSMGVCDVEVRW